MGRSISVDSINAVVSGALITSNAQAGPATPTITAPLNGTILTTFTPTFTLSTYNNQGVTQTHTATQLQIALDPAFTQVIYDTTVTTSLTSITVPANTILNTYLEIYVRVRYLSSLGYASPYSSVYRYDVSGQFRIFGSESGSNTIFSVVYFGPGSVTSATLTIANNSALTSPAYSNTVSFTNNVGSVTIATSSLPGFWALTTDYWFNFTAISGTYSLTSSGLVATPLPVDIYLTSGSGSYTTAAAFTGPLTFIIVGGGGGGSGNTASGAGGGGGYVNEYVFNANGAVTFTYVVGAKGIGGTSWGAGTAGGSSSVTISGTTYTSAGGTGGSGQTGGAGGTSGGNINQNGQTSAYGGRGGTVGNQSPGVGGEGGYGYGAGGGGQTRQASVGGSGGGGGGGGGLGSTKFATDGTFSNVGAAGDGADGVIIVRYNPT
jgi:hypothetical protein